MCTYAEYPSPISSISKHYKDKLLNSNRDIVASQTHQNLFPFYNTVALTLRALELDYEERIASPDGQELHHQLRNALSH